jgi:hypothetical protein
MINITDVIATAPLRIVSGEGVQGGIETYTGTRTERALKMRLTRERCGGQRWARAEAQHGDDWVRVL